MSCGRYIRQAPCNLGYSLQSFDAILASVLVGAMPMLTGMPVLRRTVRLMCRPNSSSRPVSMPRKSRNASSMEYTSAAGTMRRSVQITRRDMSP